MKKIIPFFYIPLLFICSFVNGQEYTHAYYMDEGLNSTGKANALIIGKGFKDKNLFRIDCYSIRDNRLLLTLHCTDSSFSDLEGIFTSYHGNGKTRNTGSYENSLKEREWNEWDSLGRFIDSAIYKQDKKMQVATFSYYANNLMSCYTFRDSLLDTYHSINYDEASAKSSEVFFIGQKGILRSYTSTGIQTDSLFTREEIEADFPGGEKGWRRYLQDNLDPNVPVNHRSRAGIFPVVVRFIVKKDGSIDDVKAETNFGYGMEKEVIRIIKNGPKWIPATQYGRKVNAYRRQPVTFVVAEQ